jgi:hypothetical protein
MHADVLQMIGFARAILWSIRQACFIVFCLGSSSFDTLQSAALAFKPNYWRWFEKSARTSN